MAQLLNGNCRDRVNLPAMYTHCIYIHRGLWIDRYSSMRSLLGETGTRRFPMKRGRGKRCDSRKVDIVFCALEVEKLCLRISL